MFDAVNPTDIFTIIGGALGGVTALAFAFMKFWRMISSSNLSNVKDSTESTLITSMLGDIERLRSELMEVKDQHKADLESIREVHRKDREDFLLEIAGLKRELGLVKRKNESAKAEALDAYAYVVRNESEIGTSCSYELKDRLMKIAVENI
jgi:hypothetical protein